MGDDAFDTVNYAEDKGLIAEWDMHSRHPSAAHANVSDAISATRKCKRKEKRMRLTSTSHHVKKRGTTLALQ